MPAHPRSVLSLASASAFLWLLTSCISAQAPAWTWRLHPEHCTEGKIRPEQGPHVLTMVGTPRFVGYDETASWFHCAEDPVPRTDPLPADASLPDKRFTVELWTAIDSVDQQAGLVSLQGSRTDDPDGARGFWLGVADGRWQFGVDTTRSGRVVLSSKAKAEAREWTHLVATFDGRRMAMFVDGIAVGETDAKGRVEFGGAPRLHLGGAVLDGKLAGAAAALYRVCIHDRSLTKASIGKLARHLPENLVVARRSSLRRYSHEAYALDQRQGRVDRAIDRGALWLLEQQDDKGAFHNQISANRPGMTALAALALVEAGEDAQSDAIRQARTWLRENPPDQTYDLATYLLMLGAIRDDDDHAIAERMTRTLLSFESKRLPGAWAYPDGQPDLSNTQFAALGLLGAAQFGIEIPREVCERMVAVMVGQFRGKSVRTYRGGIDGQVTSYSYDVGGLQSASMTSAATSIFAIADRVADLRWDEKSKLGKARQQSLDWIAANFDECLGPYTIYGVERTAALLDMSHFGKHDWYARAADNIVGYQEPDGSWCNNSVSDVAFNLLVLRRATRRMVQQAPLTGAATIVQQRGPLRYCYRLGPAPIAWFAGFSDEWTAKGPRIVRVRWLVDGKQVATLDGDATRPWAGEAFKVEPEQLAKGRHELRVEADVVDAEGRAETITSRPLLVGG